MEQACHRCGNPVREGDGFCAHCGAPQLIVEAADAAVQQQQQAVRFRGETQPVDWRAAILCALLVAVPVGLLSALTSISSLFVIAGGFVTMALYRRRSAATTDGRIGWRVGAILGAASAAVACAADAARLLTDRYLLHQGQVIDAEFSAIAQQVADQALKANPEALQRTPQLIQVWTAFWLSPDGHAAIGLLTASMVSLGMVLFAAAGGAIAGRVLAMRTREQRTL
jgi:hypothetical protein